jgi:hypothetical protein
MPESRDPDHPNPTPTPSPQTSGWVPWWAAGAPKATSWAILWSRSPAGLVGRAAAMFAAG